MKSTRASLKTFLHYKPLLHSLGHKSKHPPVVLCPSEKVERIPPDLTLYQKDDTVRTETRSTSWSYRRWVYTRTHVLPETLGLASASPCTDAKKPVVALLSTPPRRGRRWLTDTCSMNEVPYLRKYHHSNIWSGGHVNANISSCKSKNKQTKAQVQILSHHFFEDYIEVTYKLLWLSLFPSLTVQNTFQNCRLVFCFCFF